MAKRKTITKKLRFEVFKRDNFTCQYCGRMAPDIVLEVDHINPVSNGGENEIMNLVTSCFDCNRGKGKKKLSDNQEIKKQQEQLKELSDKREQLKMMIEWKRELQKIQDEEVDEIENLLKELIVFGFSDYGRMDCKKRIREFGFSEVYESTAISIETYYVPGDKRSAVEVLKRIGGICYNRRKKREEDGN